jgi:hypothetical protein
VLKLETKADLNALYTGNIKESISLEYKASPAIDKGTMQKSWRWLATLPLLPMRMEDKSSTG